MSQTAAAPNQAANVAGNAPLIPPDEQFWQRYSPHAEFPLSSISSFVLHALLFGVLIALYFLGALLFSHGNRSVPVEAVRWDAAGGGGGHRRGQGDGPNNGTPQEAAGPAKEGSQEENPPEDDPQAKPINVQPSPRVKSQFDAPSTHFIQQTNTQTARAFSRLNQVTSNIRVNEPRTSGAGDGGAGRGGGSGDGDGKGVGNGRGDGRGTLTKREKRMIRWVMGFNPNDAQDYLNQLQGLGAILAVPIREHANAADYEPKDYRTIRNLSARPPKLHEEDISKLNRIYWFDDKRESAAQVMDVLRLNMRPSHFIAFMPKELEDKLFAMEEKHLKDNYPGRTEDDIARTKFTIKRTEGRYEVELSELKIKK